MTNETRESSLHRKGSAHLTYRRYFYEKKMRGWCCIFVLALGVFSAEAQRAGRTKHFGERRLCRDEDAAANIYLAETISLAPDSTLLLKTDSAGRIIWTKKLACIITDLKAGVSNLFIGGIFRGTVSFGTGLLRSTGEGDAFVAVYDPNGRVVWARQTRGRGQAYVSALVVNAADEGGVSIITDGSKQFNGTSLRKGAGLFALDKSGASTNAVRMRGNISEARLRMGTADNISLPKGYDDSAFGKGARINVTRAIEPDFEVKNPGLYYLTWNCNGTSCTAKMVLDK